MRRFIGFGARLGEQLADDVSAMFPHAPDKFLVDLLDKADKNLRNALIQAEIPATDIYSEREALKTAFWTRLGVVRASSAGEAA
jgi:hypothetical protein